MDFMCYNCFYILLFLYLLLIPKADIIFFELFSAQFRTSVVQFLLYPNITSFLLNPYYQFYLLRRKIVHCISMLAFVVSTTSSKRIVIHSYSSPICLAHLVKLKYILRQIFAMITIWFVLLTVKNEKLLSEFVIDYLSNL